MPEEKLSDFGQPCSLHSLCLKQDYHQSKESAGCILRALHHILCLSLVFQRSGNSSEFPSLSQQTFQTFSIFFSLKELLLPCWKQQKDWSKMPSISYDTIHTQSRLFTAFFIFKWKGACFVIESTFFKLHLNLISPGL